MRGEQFYQIFLVLRRDYGVDALQKARNFIKDSTCINKCHRNLEFNHSCLRENLLPKSLQFSPPIRSSRGFRLARKQNRFYFVAKRHININYVSFLLFAIVATGSREGTNGLKVKQQPKFKFYVWQNWPYFRIRISRREKKRKLRIQRSTTMMF